MGEITITVRENSEYQLRPGAPLVPAVLSALRGWDGEEDISWAATIKAHIVSRVRALVFVDYPGDFQTAPWNPRDVASHRAILQSEPPHGMGHWLEHLVRAVEFTREDPIWGGRADELLRYLSPPAGIGEGGG